MKLAVLVMLSTIFVLWVTSHLRFCAMGVNSKYATFALLAETGSISVGRSLPTTNFLPFLEARPYGGQHGAPPTVVESMKGFFCFGEHPRLIWFSTISVPFWLVSLLTIVGYGILRFALKQRTAPPEQGTAAN